MNSGLYSTSSVLQTTVHEKLHLVDPERLQRVAHTLLDFGFCEIGLLERCRVRNLWDLHPGMFDQRSNFERPDALDLLIDLFVLEVQVPLDRLRTSLSTLVVKELLEAEMVCIQRVGDKEFAAAAMALRMIGLELYGFDRRLPLSGSFDEKTRVFDPSGSETAAFRTLLPRRRCRRFLDLCTGCGIAAIVAARHFADSVDATDINPRAIAFAEFNARVNRARTASFRRGDLYEPIHGNQYDYIVAHPPQVASLQNAVLFRDGGVDGEEVTRQILSDLPRFLSRGGWFYARVTAAEQAGDSTFERRVAELLGAEKHEFDILFAVDKTTDRCKYLSTLGTKLGYSVEKREALDRTLHRAGVSRFTYGFLLLQRAERARRVFVSRRSIESSSALFE